LLILELSVLQIGLFPKGLIAFTSKVCMAMTASARERHFDEMDGYMMACIELCSCRPGLALGKVSGTILF
jgi:hypothetical protein